MSVVSSPSRVWGRAPAEKGFRCFSSVTECLSSSQKALVNGRTIAFDRLWGSPTDYVGVQIRETLFWKKRNPFFKQPWAWLEQERNVSLS